MGVARTLQFRKANGVYMKLMNFRRFDPAYIQAGKSGLSKGNKGEEAIWLEFSGNPIALRETASAIRLAIDDDGVDVRPRDDDYEAEEGGIVLRLHLSRERDRRLTALKKQEVAAQRGKLECEVCDFDFATLYGDLGRNYIEAHHRRPVSTLVSGEKTRLQDLALVCANCHRMLHRNTSALSVEELRASLRRSS